MVRLALRMLLSISCLLLAALALEHRSSTAQAQEVSAGQCQCANCQAKRACHHGCQSGNCQGCGNHGCYSTAGRATGSGDGRLLHVSGKGICYPYGDNYCPDLFYNFYAPATPCGGEPVQMYISPLPVPPIAGHTYVTYQPLLPHEFLYPHHRSYHRFYNKGQGLNMTCVHWFATSPSALINNLKFAR